jgi:hypothetical protein
MGETGEEEDMEHERPKRIRMNPDSEPVVEDARLPAMDDQARSDVMGEVAEAAGGRVMSEPPPSGDRLMSEPPPSGEEAAGEYPDMEPITAHPAADAESFAAGEHGEGYVRLVVGVEEGNMRVIDGSVVEGPLVEENLTGQMAYQAIVRGRRIGAEAFSDLAVEHAYAPPDDESGGHSVGEIASYQFVVRIPRSEITLDDLSELEIELVRPTTDLLSQVSPRSSETFDAAAATAGVESPSVVARVEGVNLDELPERAGQALRTGLR